MTEKPADPQATAKPEPRQEDVEALLFLAEKANARWAEIKRTQLLLLVALQEAMPCVPPSDWHLRTIRLMEEAEAAING